MYKIVHFYITFFVHSYNIINNKPLQVIVSDMTSFYEVPIYFYGDKESLGRAIGKGFRASLAIVDENLAKAVETKLLQNKTE